MVPVRDLEVLRLGNQVKRRRNWEVLRLVMVVMYCGEGSVMF